MQVQIPGLGRPLEEGIATNSSILAWRIPWTEHKVAKELDMTEATEQAACMKTLEERISTRQLEDSFMEGKTSEYGFKRQRRLKDHHMHYMEKERTGQRKQNSFVCELYVCTW